MTAGTEIDLAKVFKALGDPTRLAIYETVRDAVDTGSEHSPRELRNSVSQIARRFDVSLSTVSHHLKELRSAGLIRCERRGRNIYCSIEPDALEAVGRFATPE